MEKIKALDLPQITIKQLNNLKSRLKIKKLGCSNHNLSDLFQWCKDRTEHPEDLHQVFCGSIDHKVDKNDELDCLRIFITT